MLVLERIYSGTYRMPFWPTTINVSRQKTLLHLLLELISSANFTRDIVTSDGRTNTGLLTNKPWFVDMTKHFLIKNNRIFAITKTLIAI